MKVMYQAIRGVVMVKPTYRLPAFGWKSWWQNLGGWYQFMLLSGLGLLFIAWIVIPIINNLMDR